jgi:hypothetical protein
MVFSATFNNISVLSMLVLILVVIQSYVPTICFEISVCVVCECMCACVLEEHAFNPYIYKLCSLISIHMIYGENIIVES